MAMIRPPIPAGTERLVGPLKRLRRRNLLPFGSIQHDDNDDGEP
jgi:hypothetical protein